jgi:hypothetical protein
MPSNTPKNMTSVARKKIVRNTHLHATLSMTIQKQQGSSGCSQANSRMEKTESRVVGSVDGGS